MAQRKGEAGDSAEALLCRDGVEPQLLAAKLDELDYDARVTLFSKRKNIVAIGSRLTEVRAKSAFQSRRGAAALPRRGAPRRCVSRRLVLRMACARVATPRKGRIRSI